MNAFGSGGINRENKIAVDILCHKRNHRSGKLADGFKSGVKGHVGVNFIL